MIYLKQALYLFAFFFTLAIPFSVIAADSDLDSTFTVGSGVNGTVIATALQTNGKVIIGGNFDVVGGVRRKKVARLNADGSLDTAFTNGSGVDGNGIVETVAVQADGKVLIGGEFFSVNGTARSYFARLNTDGSLDTSFTAQISDSVLSIIVQPDGKILIAGEFMQVNGSFSSRRLARLNPDGTQDMSFVYSLWLDLNPSAMALQTDGRILVVANNRIARLLPDGTFDGFNLGNAGLSGFAQALDYNSADGSILVGGNITSYNGVARSNLIKISSNAGLDVNFNPVFTGTISGGSISSIKRQPDGKILISGYFDTVNGVSRNGLARLNSDGTLDSSFAPALPFTGSVINLQLQPDNKIVVGGQFTTIAGASRNRIARLNANGTIDPNFSRKRGPNDSVFSIVPTPDGKILIGGFFNSVDETPQGGIARLAVNGLLDPSFNSGSGFDGAVGKIALQPDGKMMVGGAFTTYNGTARKNIARLNTDGTLDPSFDAGTGVDAIITDMEIQADGKVIICGLFFNVGGVAGRNIARLNANGTLDATFNPGTGADFEVYDIELQSNGQILIGGNFDHYNGATRSSIARINSNGSLDTSFNASTQFDSAILSLVSQPDGHIVVGGAFNTVNSAQRCHVARLNSNGTEDSSFQLTGGFSSDFVNKVTLQSDGKVLVGGKFLELGNFNRAHLGRLFSNGAVDTAFNTGGVSGGINNDAEVDDVVFQPNGKILFAGEFTAVGGIEANRVARLVGTFVAPPADAFVDFDGDGRTDISVFRPASGEWWINRSSTSQTVAAQFGLSTDKPVPGDFTGDGKTDIAFWRPSTGEWFILRSEDSSFLSFPFGTSGDIPIVGDFDNDGKADPGVFRTSNLTWFISKSTGGTIITTFGAAGDVPTPADYDGDGKTDIAIYRPSAGEWWIAKSSNNSVYAFQFGTASDKPVQGDYTGDGRADAAFWRPSTGEWFILRSEDSSYFSFPFGAGGDLPVPGDYDGDGKFDPAVFRPSNTTWFINRTTAGLLITNFGAAGDRPVPSVFVP
jgi:uncharacterized delta-60 repeat protein